MKKNRKFWVALIIFSLTGQIAWVVENMYFNVFIYKMFRASAADIALMVTASSVAATLTTILIGALSDRIGKRKIFMCAGYIAWGVSIIAFALVRADVISAVFVPSEPSFQTVCTSNGAGGGVRSSIMPVRWYTRTVSTNSSVGNRKPSGTRNRRQGTRGSFPPQKAGFPGFPGPV